MKWKKDTSSEHYCQHVGGKVWAVSIIVPTQIDKKILSQLVYRYNLFQYKGLAKGL